MRHRKELKLDRNCRFKYKHIYNYINGINASNKGKDYSTIGRKAKPDYILFKGNWL